MDKIFENKVRRNFEFALNRFDFANVYNVMDYIDWTWCGDNRVPSQARMLEEVVELFGYAIKDFVEVSGSSEVYAGSGGFIVKIYPSGKVEIQFILEESESWEYESL